MLVSSCTESITLTVTVTVTVTVYRSPRMSDCTERRCAMLGRDAVRCSECGALTDFCLEDGVPVDEHLCRQCCCEVAGCCNECGDSCLGLAWEVDERTILRKS